MTDPHPQENDHRQTLRDALRLVRQRYDALERGKSAQIRRSRSADDLALEGSYWRVATPLAQKERHLVHVVLHFPLARHATSAGFAFGRYLRRQLGDGDGAALRFRRLLDSYDRDDLDHRLRGILKLAAADGTPVDWGVLGADILWFFAESDNVRRRWAQDFYAPTSREASPAAAPSATASTPNA